MLGQEPMRIVPSASTSPLGPILGLEPLIGLLVVVVWWDAVIATPFVQYQAEQCNFNGVKHPRKT